MPRAQFSRITNAFHHFTDTAQRRQAMLAFAVAIEVFALATVPSIQQTLAAATSHQAEQFSELYFNTPDKLPRQIVAGRSAQFSYTLTSHYSSVRQFHINVSILENTRPRTIKSSAITVYPGESFVSKIDFETEIPNVPLVLTVDAPAEHASLHFASHS